MTTPLPLRPLLDLFRQHHTDSLSMGYDEAADVLYINFQRPSGPGRDTAPRSSLLGSAAYPLERGDTHPSAADHSELDEDDTIRRYQGDRMVGFTILNASQRE